MENYLRNLDYTCNFETDCDPGARKDLSFSHQAKQLAQVGFLPAVLKVMTTDREQDSVAIGRGIKI